MDARSESAPPWSRGGACRPGAMAALLLALLLSGAVPGSTRQAASEPAEAKETVTITTAGDLGPVTLRHGFLHGLDGTAGYSAVKVAALRPANWRLSKYQTYAFVADLDARVTYTLSDPYAWARGGYPAVAPWTDWPDYEAFVRTRVTQILAAFPNRPPAFWDIWNEPDHPFYWHGTYDQLLELFARTVAVVRAVDPAARFVGPSVAAYRGGAPGVADVAAFLADLDARFGVRVDAVAWHENHTYTPDLVVAHAADIRRDLAALFGPAYRPELHVNEHMGTEVHSAPGWNVGYLYYLEQARIDAWMRACWNVYDSARPGGGPTRWSDCWAGLNGMFMSDGVTEQPAYWVQLAYAETEGETRLPVTSSTRTTTVLASRDDASRRVRLLVGRHGGSATADVTLRLAEWPWQEPVVVRAARVPTAAGFRGNPSQAIPLPNGPVPAFSRRLDPSADADLTVLLPAFAEGEAWQVDFVPAPRIWLPLAEAPAAARPGAGADRPAMALPSATARSPATSPGTVPQAWPRGPSADPAFFPIGVWLQDPANAPAYRDIGINLFIGLWEGPTTTQLDGLRAAGMPVIADQNDLALGSLDDAILVGWLQQDEPDNAQPDGSGGYGPCVEPSAVVSRYERLRTADPSRPVLLNLGQGVAHDYDRPYVGRGSACSRRWDQYPEYVKGADIVSFDIYPVTSPYEHIRGDLWRVALGVDRLLEWTKGEKPVWTVIETTHIHAGVRPTPEQIRSEVWMALIHGASGFLYFAHEWQPRFREAGLLHYPDTRDAVAALNRQIHDLAAVLNSPSVPGGVRVTSSNPDVPVDVMVKRQDGWTYILSVAMRDAPTEAAFALPGGTVGGPVEVLGEDRTIMPMGTTFRDTFGGYAVHLYRIPVRSWLALPWLTVPYTHVTEGVRPFAEPPPRHAPDGASADRQARMLDRTHRTRLLDRSWPPSGKPSGSISSASCAAARSSASWSSTWRCSVARCSPSSLRPIRPRRCKTARPNG